ncbi:MAG TPA: hypothetical protein VGC35_13005 [Allosphingosinicella sp.]|jgi:hypothetical protein
MPTPAARRRTRENARFLAALTRTGNARLAARELGVHRATYTKRRARDPAFAAAWAAALAAARPHRRRPRVGGISAATDAALLDYLSQGWSLRLAASECGFAHSSFLALARRDPAFAHELKVAAAIGQDRLQLAIMDRNVSGTEGLELRILPMPRMTVEQAMLQLEFANPHGRFQRSVNRRPHLPPKFEAVAPAIAAKVAAMLRQRHFNETGSWRLPSEG